MEPTCWGGGLTAPHRKRLMDPPLSLIEGVCVCVFLFFSPRHPALEGVEVQNPPAGDQEKCLPCRCRNEASWKRKE